MSDNYFYPKELKKLRACTGCGMIKTESQFLEEGCPNCNFDVSKKEMLQYITSNFKGIIAITNPRNSWAAKWLHKANYYPGFYCVDIIKEDEDNEEYEEDDNQFDDYAEDNKVSDYEQD